MYLHFIHVHIIIYICTCACIYAVHVLSPLIISQEVM